MQVGGSGLSGESVAMYKVVLERGDLDTESLAAACALPADRTRRAVGELVRAGLVSVVRTNEGPVRVQIGVPSALRGLLGGPNASRSTQRLLEARRSLDDVLQVDRLAPTSGFQRIDDLDELREKMPRLAAATRSEVLALHAGSAPSADALVGAAESDLEVLARGIRLRSICPQSYVEHEHVRDYVAQLADAGGEVRFTDRIPHRLIVLDGTHAVVPLDADTFVNGAVLITEPRAVGGLRLLAQTLFRQGRPLQEVLATGVAAGPSDTDRRVLLLMSSGATDEVAARRLGVTDRQYRRYVAKVLTMLGATSRFQAGVRAVERGWL